MLRPNTQEEFSEAIFARDGRRCVMCRAEATAVHFLMASALWEDGGLHRDNAVSLCESCGERAQRTLISVDELRASAGIRSVRLPGHLDPELRYDTWSNVIVNQHRRSPGELFYREDVQKLLAGAGLLDLFDGRIKYPRTMHFAWSANLQNDDRRLITEKYFEGEEIIVTEKLDGENTTLTRDFLHARSLDSKDHPSRAWVKRLHGNIRHQIPERWRICGENVYARHSIAYDALESYFYVFNIWERGSCLSWDDTVEYTCLLGLPTVPVIYRGPWNRAQLIGIADDLDEAQCEGYVARVARAFDAHEFSKVAGKFVRRGHVRTSAHWMEGPVVPNRLISAGETPS